LTVATGSAPKMAGDNCLLQARICQLQMGIGVRGSLNGKWFQKLPEFHMGLQIWISQAELKGHRNVDAAPSAQTPEQIAWNISSMIRGLQPSAIQLGDDLSETLVTVANGLACGYHPRRGAQPCLLEAGRSALHQPQLESVGWCMCRAQAKPELICSSFKLWRQKDRGRPAAQSEDLGFGRSDRRLGNGVVIGQEPGGDQLQFEPRQSRP